MRKSLQKIEDYYAGRGLRGVALREAVQSDKRYHEILTEKKRKLAKRIRVTPNDKKRYVLSTDIDYEILHRIYELERRKLYERDKELIKFIRTQLEHDWRQPIIKILKKLMVKYTH